MSQSLTHVSKAFSALSGAWTPGKADRYGIAGKTDVLKGKVEKTSSLWESLAQLGSQHVAAISETYGSAAKQNLATWQKIWSQARPPQAMGQDYYDYAVDAAQRSILFLDIMRQVGNHAVEQQIERQRRRFWSTNIRMIMDGRQQQPPVNYALVHIQPPAGVEDRSEQAPLHDHRPARRPWPWHRRLQERQPGRRRARAGHAVYFVIFFQQPEPGQTMADVCALEGRFFREVRAAPSERAGPVTVGNCQGGWAADAAGGLQPARHRPDRRQRRAAELLGRRARQEPDALHGRPDRRRGACADRLGPGQRPLRRRPSRDEFREG